MIAGLSETINQAVEYLSTHQTPSGRFRVWTSIDPCLPVNSTLENSVFATACILYSMEWLQSPAVKQIRETALNFLCSESSKQGLFRYYASSSQAQNRGGNITLPLVIPFDADTTSCASLILQRYGMAPDNKDILLAHCNEAGTFPTWLMQEAIPEAEDNFPFVCLMPVENSVCAGVNANVLSYLGKSELTSAARRFLVDTLCRGVHLENSDYYSDEVVLFYFYSRAYSEGIRSFSELKQTLTDRLFKHQKPNGSFGTSLQTAMAICTLANLEITWQGEEAAIKFLQSTQSPNGSWPRCTFYIGDPEKVRMRHFLCFGGSQREIPPSDRERDKMTRYFGSEEITTAYCLEALSRYREAGL